MDLEKIIQSSCFIYKEGQDLNSIWAKWCQPFQRYGCYPLADLDFSSLLCCELHLCRDPYLQSDQPRLPAFPVCPYAKMPLFQPLGPPVVLVL